MYVRTYVPRGSSLPNFGVEITLAGNHDFGGGPKGTGVPQPSFPIFCGTLAGNLLTLAWDPRVLACRSLHFPYFANFSGESSNFGVESMILLGKHQNGQGNQNEVQNP